MQGDAALAVDARPLRLVGGAILGVAAVRPLVANGHLGVTCPLRSLTGVPCPFCGMTRGVTALVHGDIGRAALLNPGSVLVVLAAVVLVVMWRVERVTAPTWLVPTIVALLWAFELTKYALGLPL